MMRKIAILVILGWMMTGGSAFSSDGEDLFKAEGCMRCHKADGNSKIYPSLPRDRSGLQRQIRTTVAVP